MSIFTEKEGKIVYSGRVIQAGNQKLLLPIDVRTLITPNDCALQDLIEQQKLKGSSDDETMWNIQKWVAKNIKYVSDSTNSGVPEYWQFPFETLALRLADCEDGAILIASLAICAGIPVNKVRVVAGFVKPHEVTAPEGGHGYVAFERADKSITAIDWCFYEDSNIEMSKKPAIENNPLYKAVWFSFNNEKSYAEQEWNVTTRLAK
jgi:hypothetical protein